MSPRPTSRRLPGEPCRKSPRAKTRSPATGKSPVWNSIRVSTFFPTPSPSFPAEITDPFQARTGRKILGNRHGSGTAIVDELGDQALRDQAFIIYTSADSVFQIAAHTDAIPLQELYAACEIARELCNPYRVGRVIARPFAGKPGQFQRTRDRVDYAFQPDEPTILEATHAAGIPVYSVGKIEDIYAHRGITQGWHTGSNEDAMAAVDQLANEKTEGLIFANFIDYDMLYGHRRDPEGYARCLEHTDRWLADFLPKLQPDDHLIITADHGNDPTFKGTDHTREFVPLLAVQPESDGRNVSTEDAAPVHELGLRKGFFDNRPEHRQRFRASADAARSGVLTS